MSKVLCIAILLISANFALARQDCPKAKVEHVQIENHYAHIKLVGYPWRHIGKIDSVGTKERIALLLAAQLAQKEVVIGYPDGYDCSVSNLGVSMIVARLYN